jgi:sporulation protein YlmC with PRC-barrel domain
MAAILTGLSLLTAVATAQQPGQPGQPGAQPGAQPGQAENRFGQAENRLGQPGQTAHKGEICMASKLEQMSVKTQDGQQVGMVKDLLIDTQSGHVKYVAISATAAGTTPGTTPGTERPATQPGQPGQQGQFIVVPWSALHAQKSGEPGQPQAQQHLTLNLDKNRLQQAPRFTQQQLASPAGSAEWSMKVNEFYGTDRTEVLRPELNDRDTRQPGQPGATPQPNRGTQPQPNANPGAQPGGNSGNR